MESSWQRKLFDVLLVVSYLVIWFTFVFISKNLGFFESLDSGFFLTLSFLIMVFGMITKSTSWSIGNKFFSVTGDSKRHIEYSSHDNWKNSDAQKTGFTIKIDHDDPGVIKQLMSHHAKLRKDEKKDKS